MTGPAIFVGLFALLSLQSGTAAAQTIRETQTLIDAEPRIGFEYRKDIDAALESALQGDLASAWKQLEPALAYCDAQQRPGRRALGFADHQEYEAYLAAEPVAEPTEWINIACPSAYYHAGYLHVSAKAYAQAQPLLDKAIAMAPYYADPFAERGFILNQLGDFEAGIENYRKAIALAEKWPKQAQVKSRALRGIGWAYVEAGDLDAAQKAYEASLVVEPDNSLAKSELEYIAKQRAKSGQR